MQDAWYRIGSSLIPQYTNLIPRLDAHGFKGTFYTISGAVSTLETYLTWADLISMHNNGHDIQCHSADGSGLSTLTAEQIRVKMETVNTDFAANGLPTPIHHAYPGGAHNATVDATVAEYRLTGRGVTGSLFKTPAFSRYGFGGLSIDTLETNWSGCSSLAIQAKQYCRCALYYGHDYSGDGYLSVLDDLLDLNMDGRITLVDFSILAFNWTG